MSHRGNAVDAVGEGGFGWVCWLGADMAGTSMRYGADVRRLVLGRMHHDFGFLDIQGTALGGDNGPGISQLGTVCILSAGRYLWLRRFIVARSHLNPLSPFLTEVSLWAS